jgi:hypothetical protein
MSIPSKIIRRTENKPTVYKNCLQAGTAESTPPKTTQYTVNSTFSLNYKVQP